MFFRYDPNKLREYRKNGIFATLPIFCVSLITIFPILYITMRDIENIIFILSMTFIMMIFSVGIGLFIGYKKAKKEFESYKIEFDDTKIIITSNTFHKEIRFEQINKILKDYKNNIYIVINKINKIRILHYIENMEEFEKYLSNISPIEQYNSKYNILQYVPVVFLIALMYISKTGNIQLYLIFAIIVILTIIYSIVKLILDQIKPKYKIIFFIVYGFILYSVIRGIYSVIIYLRM